MASIYDDTVDCGVRMMMMMMYDIQLSCTIAREQVKLFTVYFFWHNVLALYCFIGFRKIVRFYRHDAAKSMPQYFF